MPPTKKLPSLPESLGLLPLRLRLRQARNGLAGMPHVPGSSFDLSSLALLAPRLAFPLWRGRFATPRRVVLTNLFNHRQTPIEEGWSVRKRQVEDFRGRGLTYDSHNGTDLSVPRGTTMVAPAAGRVTRIFSEFNRGGLKLVLDHGEGLLTCSAHLARTLVQEGDLVELGQPVAITAYSGMDGFVTFPFGIPHIHFNVWLNGLPVDPFSKGSEASLWIQDYPTPAPIDATAASTYEAPEFDKAIVERVIAGCITPKLMLDLGHIEDAAQQGLRIISERNYYPTRFTDHASIYRRVYERRPRLYMPFSAADVDGADLFDEV